MFLSLGGVLFLHLFAIGCSCPPVQSPAAANLQRFEFDKPQMGVPFRIVLYAPSEAFASRAADAAWKRIEALNAIMSDYEPESELNKLSRTSGQHRKVPVSGDLWQVLHKSQQWAHNSDGMFDVTVGPCITLWRRARRERRLPDKLQLAEAMNAVGFNKMKLDPVQRTVELTVPKMKLDLGGIAKGYAVDQALLTLKHEGISSALVAAAGDIGVSDPPPGRDAWRIEIAPLDDEPAANARSISLKNGAISTSGDSSQRLEIDGTRYSHIVDPHTGVGLTDHSLVTVVASDCTTSDALSTAVSALGPKQGLRLIKQTPGAAGRIVRKVDGKIEKHFTAGFERRLQLGQREEK